MNRQEIASRQFETDFDLSDLLIRPNILLSERLDSGDEPFERVNGVIDGLFTETGTSDGNGE